MFDFNFYEPFKKKPSKFEAVQKILVAIVILVLIGELGLTAYTFAKIKTTESERKEIERQIVEIDKSGEVEKVKKLEAEVKKSELVVSNFGKFDVAMQLIDVINSNLVSELFSKVGNNLYLDKFEISGTSIKISGKAYKKGNIASFEKDLRALEYVGNVSVTSIKTESEATGKGKDNQTLPTLGEREQEEEEVQIYKNISTATKNWYRNYELDEYDRTHKISPYPRGSVGIVQSYIFMMEVTLKQGNQIYVSDIIEKETSLNEETTVGEGVNNG